MAFEFITPYRPRGLARRTNPGTGLLLFDLQRQMNGLFDDLFEPRSLGATVGFPAMDVSQDATQIRICAELPGVKADDVELSIEDGVLTLSGEKKCSRKSDEEGHSERNYGRFERRISLPSNIDEEHCRADFEDGVLTVTIRKAEQKRRGRRIPLGELKLATGNHGEEELIESGAPSPTDDTAAGQAGSWQTGADDQKQS